MSAATEAAAPVLATPSLAMPRYLTIRDRLFSAPSVARGAKRGDRSRRARPCGAWPHQAMPCQGEPGLTAPCQASPREATPCDVSMCDSELCPPCQRTLEWLARKRLSATVKAAASILATPCRAEPSAAAPSHTEPNLAMPRRATPSNSILSLANSYRDNLEPAVMPALLRPPITEADSARADVQPRL